MDKISNNKSQENIYSIAAAGVIGGTGFALAGYDSKPWLKNGVPSDEFVKKCQTAYEKANGIKSSNVKKEVVEYINKINDAKSYDDLFDAQLKFLEKEGSSFENIQDILKTEINRCLKDNKFDMCTTDYILDMYNSISHSKDVNNLKSGYADWCEFVFGENNFDVAKKFLREEVLEKNAQSEIVPVLNVQKAIDETFNPVQKIFELKNGSDVSSNTFDILKKVAKNMQIKTACIWGLTSAVLFGGFMFVINSIFSNKNTNKSQNNTVTKT